MNLISEIQREKRLFGTCPHCGEEFQICKAQLFSLRGKPPAEALRHIAELKRGLEEARVDIRKRKHQMTDRAQITVASVNLGKILEKIIPSFRDFQYQTGDCRSLLEPIDYVIFSGLTKTGAVDSLTFLDVKSGGARLTATQREIESAVGRGHVEFDVVQPGDEGEK
jgi:predicted Holliday junction resolvase-like endonuclease